MPISQIDLFRVENTDQYVNQRLLCLVTEVNPEERNLVVSRRALLEREREQLREKFWAEVAEGQVREGIVRSLQPFGAFIDLGGGDGLLHVSEMAWNRVKDPSEVLQLGQRVKVIVLRVDREARKLALGLKQLTEGPWDNAHLTYPPGSIVTGKVTRIQDFGAFVELEPGVEGLIHISELSGQRVRRVRDVVQEDQQVTVKVLDVNREQRRMSLSLKAAVDAAKPETPEEPEEAEVEEPAKPKRERTTPLRGGIGSKWELPGSKM
jgi:small subunit ribosomal protein S1